MGKKRSAAQFFDDAETNGHELLLETELNNDKVAKKLEGGTEINYKRMLDLWDEYARRNSGASPYDIKTSKHFMEGVVRGCSANKEGPSMYTMRQKWTDFAAGWKRRPGNVQIPSETSESIYFYVETELQKKFRLSTERRTRHHITVHHFVILIKHMWRKDWHQYRHPRTLVQDHALYLLFIYSSARVGEYLESNMRRNSGRGLLYENIDFVIFKNESGRPEIGIRVTRDAKGFTNTPHKRPKHGMYEDMEPLFANPVLPLLAVALADDAFQNYRTFEEIEAIPPPVDGSLHHLRIRKQMLHVPFFQTVAPDGPTGKIQKAGPFSTRTVSLGHRAGYQENIGIHDIRAEVLVKADDNGYSVAERMKFAGHNNADTFLGSYMPQLSTVDGISSYWNRKRRTVHLEGFRGLSLHYHPQILQSLPAKVESDLESRADFNAINQEIEALGQKFRRLSIDDKSRARREELYWRKRQLVSEELNKWQEIQPRKITANAGDEAPQVASLPSYFNRVRRLDPPRDRLASSLFLDAPLRSPQGRGALQDMIMLCRENPQVAYRPSLRPKNGRCPMAKCARDVDRISIANRWNHIYRCYKAELERRDGFAELCFQCDEWITSGRGWHEHCRRHLDDLETLPVQCNPLAFRQTLATAGHCLFCLFDSNLPPTKRFHQFLIKQSWKEHLHSHFRKLEEKYDPLQKPAESKAVPCPDPRCALSFDSLGDLQCHCQDVHCIERIKRDPAKRRRRTRQSWVDTKNCSGTSAMPESWSGYISEGMDVLTSKSLSTVAPAGQTSPEASDSIRSPSISSTCSAASHEKRSPSAASFGASKNPPTSIGWTSDEGMPGTDTPASSACPSPKMLIDPRLLEESESQLIVLSP